jgi:hypothetical protein
MPRRLFAILLFVGLLLTACSGAKLTETTREEYTGPPIAAIALAPGGGPFADAIGVELFNMGLNVVDAEQTESILARIGLTDIQVTSPESFGALREAGVDALLVVKAVMAADGTPQSASVRVTSVHDSQLIAGITWQNGWGGMRGSISDRVMRQDLAEAAAQIAKRLSGRLQIKEEGGKQHPE